MTIYNKSTPPVADPISDSGGKVTSRWFSWFSARQSFDNSIQHRWIRHLFSGFTTVDATTFTHSGAEYYTLYYPAGSRILILDGSTNYYGIVESCTFDSGTSVITWVVRMDRGYALASVNAVYYGTLTSSVID
jgi:hypothetical protein